MAPTLDPPNRLAAVVLEVGDLETSIRCYREAFGIDLHRSDHHGAGHGEDDPWVSGPHGAISWTTGDALHFALYQAHTTPTHGAQVSFRVTDVHAAHEMAVAAGVKVLHAPRTEPWGTSARYSDPDGNVVELTQPG